MTTHPTAKPTKAATGSRGNSSIERMADMARDASFTTCTASTMRLRNAMMTRAKMAVTPSSA